MILSGMTIHQKTKISSLHCLSYACSSMLKEVEGNKIKEKKKTILDKTSW